jgi:hypothetical protein
MSWGAHESFMHPIFVLKNGCDKTYAPVARLEAIRVLLVYACAYNIKLYQMDVKSAFLNGYINEEVYVEQPLSFEDDKNSTMCTS